LAKGFGETVRMVTSGLISYERAVKAIKALVLGEKVDNVRASSTRLVIFDSFSNIVLYNTKLSELGF